MKKIIYTVIIIIVGVVGYEKSKKHHLQEANALLIENVEALSNTQDVQKTETCWSTLTWDAILWGFNEKTMEWRVFDESMRGVFKPVFHLLQVRLPKWTVFTDNETPRPLGYLFTDEETGEGCFMQF